jgi:hypothetical protein
MAGQGVKSVFRSYARRRRFSRSRRGCGRWRDGRADRRRRARTLLARPIAYLVLIFAVCVRLL